MTVPMLRRPATNRSAQTVTGGPLVREFFGLMAHQGVALTDVAERAGLSHTCIAKWRRSHNPQIDTFEAALNVLGYRLAIVPIRDVSDPPLGRPSKDRTQPEGVSP